MPRTLFLMVYLAWWQMFCLVVSTAGVTIEQFKAMLNVFEYTDKFMELSKYSKKAEIRTATVMYFLQYA